MYRKWRCSGFCASCHLASASSTDVIECQAVRADGPRSAVAADADVTESPSAAADSAGVRGRGRRACARETDAVLTRLLVVLRESRRIQRSSRWLRGAANYPDRGNRNHVGAAAAGSRNGFRASRVRRSHRGGTTALARQARCSRQVGEEVSKRSFTIAASGASCVPRASIWIAFGQREPLDRCRTRCGRARACPRECGRACSGEVSARARWRAASRTPDTDSRVPAGAANRSVLWQGIALPSRRPK